MIRDNHDTRARQNSSGTPPESTGLSADATDHEHRPLSVRWITDEMLARTQAVWSKHYGRRVSPDEAVEILMNVKALAEVLMDVNQEREGQ